MARKHTPSPTSPKERREYEALGQTDFGWENAKLAALREAIRDSTVRKKKTAKRNYARPTKNGKRPVVKKTKK